MSLRKTISGGYLLSLRPSGVAADYQEVGEYIISQLKDIQRKLKELAVEHERVTNE